MTSRYLLLGLLSTVLLSGCAGTTPDYAQNEGPSEEVGDNIVRYGSIGVAGAGGYLAGKDLTGSSEGGLAVGGAAALAAYGFNKYADSKRGEAYSVGYSNGMKASRAEIANEVYRREAVYGVPPPWEANTSSAMPSYRTVYVPEHTVNGVVVPATYEEVPIYR